MHWKPLSRTTSAKRQPCWRVRVRIRPDDRRPGGLQLRLRNATSRAADGATARPTRARSATATPASRSRQATRSSSTRWQDPSCRFPCERKAIHDEMNSANFDEWGRMTANMGLEAKGATPLLQNIILYPFVNPATEILDPTREPSSLNVTPIAQRLTTGPRSGRSRTTGWIRTRCTSTSSMCRSSTGSPGTTSSSRLIPTSSAGRKRSESARSKTPIVAVRPIAPTTPVRRAGQQPTAQPDDAYRRQGKPGRSERNGGWVQQHRRQRQTRSTRS